MAKTKNKIEYACQECGARYSKWHGRCTNCGTWDSLVEEEVVAEQVKAVKSMSITTDMPEIVRMGEVDVSKLSRTVTQFAELNLVLGGGLVDRQVVLFSGEPGIGKSTLLLQLSVYLSKQGQSTLYVSGEESASQVVSRAARLFPKQDYDGVLFVAMTGVRKLLEDIGEHKPEFVVIDSIQTLFDEEVGSLPGSLAQIKSCTALLVTAAKSMGFVLIIVGHINKEGTIAGPKVLEHLVDTVLQFEGENTGEYRLLRVLKNRFGSTGEVGVFKMGESGLADIDSLENLFVGEAAAAVGAATTMVLEGARPLLVQVQALATPSVFSYPKRVAEGVSGNRLELICAVLQKFTGAKVMDKDIYVRSTGGYKINSASCDLAIAAAILSSVYGRELDSRRVFVGEVTLSGNLHINSFTSSKFGTIAKFGIKSIVTAPTSYSKKGTSPIVVSSLTSVRQLEHQVKG